MVRTFHLAYESEQSLEIFIRQHELNLYPSLLIQAFVGTSSEEAILTLRKNLVTQLPNATIIGSNSNGQIIDGKITLNPIISFTIFDQTEVKASLVDVNEVHNPYEQGQLLLSKLASFETKAVILFASHLDLDLSSFLEGMNEAKQSIRVVGGLATDTSNQKRSIVFTNDELSYSGIVAASLSGEALHVHTFVNEQWQEIGQAFTVTKASGKHLYEINGKKPLTIFEEYLGSSFVSKLPDSGVEFPFLVERNFNKEALYVVNVMKNGAVELSRPIEKGEKITFAFANIDKLMESSVKELNFLKRNPVETHFVYNCVARERYISEFTKQELQMLQQISPISGWFTYGEIGHGKRNETQLFAHSLSYLGLSETKNLRPLDNLSFKYEVSPEVSVLMSLTHLINASANDIQALAHNIQISEEYYRSLFENNTDFVYSTDLKGRFTTINPSFDKTFGFTPEEVIGKLALNFIFEQDIPRVRRHFYRALEGMAQYYDLEIPSKSGEVQLFQMKNVPITINNQAVGLFGIGRNITKERKFEQKITQLAYYDIETGLPNKMKFREITEEMLQRAKKKKRSVAVLFMDLDRFKVVNDTLGHSVGDSLLNELAQRLRELLPTGAYLGRFDGDKFTILLTKQITVNSVEKISNSILNEIQLPFIYQGKEFFITASIGVGLYPQDALEVNDLLRNADTALNKAKEQGGNSVVYYSTEMNIETIRKVEMESFLRKAIERNELFLTYQPIIDVKSRKIQGCEVLIRWAHPQWGIVSPGDFIPLAEETGLIIDIGQWILIQACIRQKQWVDEGYGDVYVSVNVSANQFQQPNFVQDVEKALNISGLPANNLCLELTETVMIQHSSHTIEIMNKLSEIGVKLAIDDFGTGYSSLSYLKHLPLHILKIDRSFVQNMNDYTPDIAIVQSVSMMAKGLSMKVVAEGVETEDQLELLAQLGCDCAQGYFIERPMPEEDMNTWLTSSPYSIEKSKI